MDGSHDGQKQQKAHVVTQDFSDNKFQTTKFFPTKNRLLSNITLTGSFVELLMKLPRHDIVEKRHIWWDVGWKTIVDYLMGLQFPSADCDYLNVAQFSQWLEKIYSKKQLDNWEVVFSGPDTADSVSLRKIGGIDVATVNRSRNGFDDRCDHLIDTKVLRDNRDMYVDIPIEKRREFGFPESNAKQSDISALRAKSGLGKTPQLIIYLVSKDSKPTKRSINMTDLNAEEDLIGIALNIPAGDVKKNYVEELSVDLSQYKDQKDME